VGYTAGARLAGALALLGNHTQETRIRVSGRPHNLHSLMRINHAHHAPHAISCAATYLFLRCLVFSRFSARRAYLVRVEVRVGLGLGLGLGQGQALGLGLGLGLALGLNAPRIPVAVASVSARCGPIVGGCELALRTGHPLVAHRVVHHVLPGARGVVLHLGPFHGLRPATRLSLGLGLGLDLG
jgi:hypothetical protein